MGAFRLVLEGECAGLAFADWRGHDLRIDRWSRALLAGAINAAAEHIRGETSAGDRVIVAYPPGPSFSVAFLAALAAGRIAVAAQAPATALAKVRIMSLAIAADAALVLGRASDTAGLSLHTLDIEPLPKTPSGVEIALSSDRIAYLQFTSGSTGAPRGVAIPASALEANINAIAAAWNLGPLDSGAFWLPPFHDMGLVGGLLAPLRLGFPSTLMHPAAFLQRPERWLRLIAETNATVSGGPNFAYDLCCDRAQLASGLDLSSWRVAVNGAEPVSEATLRRFASQFAEHGFRREAFCPGYGLAESVLFATAAQPGYPRTHAARGRTLVSCGRPARDTSIAIVDPETLAQLPTGTEGEIWLAGSSVAAGYWRDRARSTEAFEAHMSDGRGPWLRTGDLGLLDAGELFISGRMKDVVIQAGRKAHAAHIEDIAVRAIGPGRKCAAIAVPRTRGEALVLILESQAPDRLPEESEVIRQAVGEALAFTIETVVATPPGGIPTTSSGKIARVATRSAFETGALTELARSFERQPAAEVA